MSCELIRSLDTTKKWPTPKVQRDNNNKKKKKNRRILKNSRVQPYSIFDLFVSCSAHIANPTCAQSFDLHSLQNGIPSTIFTITSFCKILSCNTTLLPSANSFIMIGVVRDFLSSELSHRPKVVTPSSRLLFLMPDDGFFVFVILFLLLPDKSAISPSLICNASYRLLKVA
jgi:hypothetical protein